MKLQTPFLLTFIFFLSVSVKAQEDTVRITGNLNPEEQAELDYNNGISALERKDFNTAVDLFSRSLSGKPGFEKALSNRAVGFTGLKRYNEALNDINLAISSSPENPDHYFNKSLIFAGMGRRDSQNVSLDKCLSLKGTHAFAAYYKGLLSYEDGRFDEAAGYYTIALKSDPSLIIAYNDRGSAKRALNDLPGAILDYQSAIRADPSHAYLHNNLGSALRLAKQYDRALASFQKALETDPNYTLALVNSGVTNFEKGDLPAARANFDALLKKEPKSSFAYNNLASIAIKEQDYRKAKDLATRAITMDPKNGAAFYNRGIARQMLREEEGCCEDWKKALDLGIQPAKSFINTACHE
jgi:tetratricopeptide (TPR) repeat protein